MLTYIPGLIVRHGLTMAKSMRETRNMILNANSCNAFSASSISYRDHANVTLMLSAVCARWDKIVSPDGRPLVLALVYPSGDRAPQPNAAPQPGPLACPGHLDKRKQRQSLKLRRHNIAHNHHRRQPQHSPHRPPTLMPWTCGRASAFPLSRMT